MISLQGAWRGAGRQGHSGRWLCGFWALPPQWQRKGWDPQTDRGVVRARTLEFQKAHPLILVNLTFPVCRMG